MATGGYFGADRIAHINGGLFDNAEVIDLDSDSLSLLAQVSALDWSSIEPSIFGTLFERSLDPTKRAQLGAHYTGKDDILLIVEPVLMAPLRRRWEAVQAQTRDLAAKRDAAKGKPKDKLQAQLSQLFTGFADEIAQVRVLDPSCGSGNFLYVALRLLLDLQKAVNTAAIEMGAGGFFPTVTPAQVYGLELNEYAYELRRRRSGLGTSSGCKTTALAFPASPS